MLDGSVLANDTSISEPSVAATQTHPALDATQQYCLRWNSYPATIAMQLANLNAAEDFVDVTLACEGQQLRAHKLVLSACSPYFMQMFKSTPCHHPVIFLRDVRFCQLRALLEFMYAGEVNVSQTDLPALLRTAEALQVRGLADTTSNSFVNQPSAQQNPDFATCDHCRGSASNPPPAQLPNVPLTVPTQLPPQQHQLVMDIGSSEIPSAPIPQTNSQQIPVPLPEGLETRTKKRTIENESSKENQFEASSSDSNDSQDEYDVECQFDGKQDLSHGQSLPLNGVPVPNNPFPNMNNPEEAMEGDMTELVPHSWNLGLSSMSVGGSQSEAEISDEENDEDDREIKEGYILPHSSNILPFEPQELEPGKIKVNPPIDSAISAVAGPSPSNSFPFQSTPSDKSKDLNFCSSSNPANNVPPRNRLSRSLWPPGVPYHGPQQCPYCNRVLSNVGNWRKHVYTMHFSREKDYKCCHCNSSFRTSEYLQKHYVRVHSYAPKMSRKKGLGNAGNGISSVSNNQSLSAATALTSVSDIP